MQRAASVERALQLDIALKRHFATKWNDKQEKTMTQERYEPGNRSGLLGISIISIT